jgi:hypothetical protein
VSAHSVIDWTVGGQISLHFDDRERIEDLDFSLGAGVEFPFPAENHELFVPSGTPKA